MRLFNTSNPPMGLPLLVSLLFITRGFSEILAGPVVSREARDVVRSEAPGILDGDLGSKALGSATVDMASDPAAKSKGRPVYYIQPAAGQTGSTYVSLINATPYPWYKTYNHSHNMKAWESEWPERVMPGQSVAAHVRLRTHRIIEYRESAGEVSYELQGTKNASVLQVYARYGRRDGWHIKAFEDFPTLGNEAGTQHDLGFRGSPGGVGYVLAGKEGEFISNDAPTQWMQSQLPEIGHLPLRELTLPRSHHSGLWKGKKYFGLGDLHNSLTQRAALFEQLGKGGIRVIDYSPLLLKSRFHAYHGTVVGRSLHGMLGASLGEMIGAFNNFTSLYPGELYIWDIREKKARSADHGFDLLTDGELSMLYHELRTIRHRAALPDSPGDVTQRPLSSLISRSLMEEGRSSVLIRVPTSWAGRKNFPGAREGFVSGENLPLTSRSSSLQLDFMVSKQISYLRKVRNSREAPMYNMNWLRRPSIAMSILTPLSIIDISSATWRVLFGPFWEALTDTTYPNMVTMDDIRGNSLKAMVMTINKCLAARRCGSLGDKVKGLKREVVEVGAAVGGRNGTA